MGSKIKAIEKGSGEGSSYFKINDQYQHAIYGDKIAEIKENTKVISWNCNQPCDSIKVYLGYDSNGVILFEIESNSSLTIYYELA